MRDRISRIAVLISVAAFGVLWYLDPVYSQDETMQFLLKSLVFRALGSAVFLSLCIYFGYRICHLPPRASWLVWLPCLAVVVNNLPIIGLINGTVQVDRWELLPLLIADSLLIGIFEELAFRGTLFLAILERRRDSTKKIFWVTAISSAVFGLVHLANLLEGAGVGVTLMQVGYSFLIGGMCSIVLLKTGNILFCIFLHAIFDFCGNLIPTLGSGRLWDTPTIVITAILAVLVTAWEVYVLLRVKPEETDRFYPIKEAELNEHD